LGNLKKFSTIFSWNFENNLHNPTGIKQPSEAENDDLIHNHIFVYYKKTVDNC